MKNKKLINGLDAAGLTVEDFYTDLGTIILQQIGFTEAEMDDQLYDFFNETLEQLIDMEVYEFQEQLPELAAALYKILTNRRSA